jgi:hypothetical protein
MTASGAPFEEGERLSGLDARKLAELRDSAFDLARQIDGLLKTMEPPEVKLSDIVDRFPSDIRGLLNFEFKGGQIIVKPKSFLGKDIFNRVAGVVKEIGGVYVSDGKASRFIVSPK